MSGGAGTAAANPCAAGFLLTETVLGGISSTLASVAISVTTLGLNIRLDTVVAIFPRNTFPKHNCCVSVGIK